MMTTSSTSSTKSEPVDPDERCQICQQTRVNHGDAHHKFSTDGQLTPLDPPPKPRAEPPVHRDDVPAIQARSFAVLMEILLEKNLLDAKDVIRVFTGNG